MSRAETPVRTDPVVDQFLNLLAKDVAAHPKRAIAVDVSFVECLRAGLESVEVDIDAALNSEDE